MYQSILILSILAASLTSFASPAAISKMSVKFEAQELSFFTSELTEKNLKPLITRLVNNGNRTYTEIVAMEQKEFLETSVEGTQLALDLEYLDILVEFADSKMDAAACEVSKHNTDLEDPQEPVIIGIGNVLKKFCK